MTQKLKLVRKRAGIVATVPDAAKAIRDIESDLDSIVQTLNTVEGGPDASTGDVKFYLREDDAKFHLWELIEGAGVMFTLDADAKTFEITSTGAVPSPPSGPAGGVLSGTYPNPGFAVDMATQAELDAHAALTGSSAHGALSTNTANAIVTRDASGDFAMHTLTYTGTLKSTTAVATPGALAATTSYVFASTVSGAAIMGFGTTNDVALKNQQGTTVAGVLANTTTFHVVGTFTTTGSANIGTSITATLGNITATNGAVFATGANGQIAIGRRDTSASAWSWYSTAGSLQLFDVAAGTDKITVATGGATTFAGRITASAGLTIAASQTLTGTVASSTISGFLSVSATTGTFTNVGGTLTTASQPNVTTMANLTTIGTLVAGAVPASLVTAGTFGAGDYTFPANLAVTTRLTIGTAVANPSPSGTDLLTITGDIRQQNGRLRVQRDDSGAMNTWEGYGVTPSVVIRRYQGTIASPSGIAGALTLGGYTFSGTYDGVNTATTGQVTGEATGAWASGDNPTQLAFWTTASGSSTVTKRVLLTKDGHWTPNTDNTLDQGNASARWRTGYFGTSVVSPVAYLGTNTALSSPALRIVADSGAAANVDNFRFGTQRPASNLYRIGGSIASPTAIASGDLLGALNMGGYDASTYTNVGVVLQGAATENWDSTHHGARYDMLLTANASTTNTRSVTFWPVGAVRVGTSTTAPAQGGYYGSSDNAEDIYSSATAARAAYVYTGNFKTNIYLGTYLSADTAAFVAEGSQASSAWYRVANSAVLSLMRVNGSMASPSAVLSGETVGHISFGGYGGTTFNNTAAQLVATASENFTSTNFGGSILVRLKPTGGGTFRTTWTFNANGTLTGNASAESKELILDVVGTAGTDLPTYVGRFARTGPAAVQNNDMLVRFVGRGHDGTAYSGSRAEMQFLAAGTWSATSHPTKILFNTTDSGSTTSTTRWWIDPTLRPNADNTYDIATTSTRVKTGYFYTLNAATQVTTPNVAINGTLAAGTANALSIASGTNITATGGFGRQILAAGTLIAAANNDQFFGIQVQGSYTPGAFTGLIPRRIYLNAIDVSTWTSPGDLRMLDIEAPNGTGSTNAYSIKLNAGPSGATNNYLIHATNWNIQSSGLMVMGERIRTKGYTVAGLPAGTTGDVAHVTDALAPAFLTAVVGGGAVKTLVFYDGTNWVAA